LPTDKLQQLSDAIDTLNNEVTDAIKFNQKKIEDTADTYAQKPSQWLAAICGGSSGFAAGSALAYLVFSTTHLVTLAASCPAILMAMGVSGTMYWWRNRHSLVTLEGRINKIERATEFSNRLIHDLPADTDPAQRRKLIDEHGAIVSRFHQLVLEDLPKPTSGAYTESQTKPRTNADIMFTPTTYPASSTYQKIKDTYVPGGTPEMDEESVQEQLDKLDNKRKKEEPSKQSSSASTAVEASADETVKVGTT